MAGQRTAEGADRKVFERQIGGSRPYRKPTRLPGTVFTAAEQIESAGGSALPIVGDIRDEAQVERAVAQTAQRFGGIDVCINNASAINLSGTETLEMKRYDLMQGINTRGTFVVTRACIPHLKRATNPHILTLSPPISLEPRWLGPHMAYTIAIVPLQRGRCRPTPPGRCRDRRIARVS